MNGFVLTGNRIDKEMKIRAIKLRNPFSSKIHRVQEDKILFYWTTNYLFIYTTFELE